MKPILVLNPGSTSFKFKLFDLTDGEQICAEGTCERIGQTEGSYRISSNGKIVSGRRHFDSCLDAFSFSVENLIDLGCITSLADVGAAAFKTVHGGEISGTCLVDDSVLAAMERYASLAPAHNPVYLSVMKTLREHYPKLVLIARFETSFHQSVPEYRRVYGIPFEWAQTYGIKRYGFHGSSHEYIAWRIGQILPQARRIISMHLGGSSSVCAIQDGRSVAVSMGATPQSGLFHNNRVGDFDPFCLPYLMDQTGLSLEETLQVLGSESGFVGLSGLSSDLREVEEAYGAGDPRARLTIQAFVDNLAGYVGQYAVYLEGIEALVFTGGIGYNSRLIRRLVCQKLAYMGVAIEETGEEEGDRVISPPDSRIHVLAVKTDEERIIARYAKTWLES